MIKIDIIKLDATGITCSNPNCQHLPEYTNHILGDNYHIKPDTTVVIIAAGTQFSEFLHHKDVYCRGCIDEIYAMIKSKLDTKLWPFH